ncbi:Virulence-associated protein I [Candidatus Jidaibacter acanthamoeba]|uniref:Virulence-associated protein I n=1 Tax=Candidatus Jidaibacter acanthamoebae TaxID=86105 RepID=A0A0C1QLB3_9RICK|nr:HigA family addiction module antitoxin [Candidatus Jidaibacter acanthamoeba]KIE06294.1 Virulence-associated protein I [Candidatus Jidaibacter acanthamoeba]
MTHTDKRLAPITPGEILLEEFLVPYGISQNKLARDIDVPLTRINDIVKGKRGISADTALRLARYFNTSADLWLGLQAEYDLRTVHNKLGSYIEKRVVPYQDVKNTR